MVGAARRNTPAGKQAQDGSEQPLRALGDRACPSCLVLGPEEMRDVQGESPVTAGAGDMDVTASPVRVKTTF